MSKIVCRIMQILRLMRPYLRLKKRGGSLECGGAESIYTDTDSFR